MRQHHRSLLFLVAAVLSALMAGLVAVPASAAEAKQEQRLRIVALGDSLTAGYGLPAGSDLASVLEKALLEKGYAVEVVNAGVSGDTVSGGLARLDWSVEDGTDGVILALGANDMLRGLDPAQTQKTLETIVTRLQARGIPVMLAGMLATRNLGPDYVARFDAIYPEIARRHSLVLYPFLLEGVAGNGKLNLPDGIHPTAEGVRAIVARMLPSVETFLSRLAAR